MNLFSPSLLLAAALSSVCLPLMAAERVSVVFDWTPNTNFVGLYVADALGLYEDAGIELDIAPYAPGQAPADVSVFGVLDFYVLKAAGLDALAVYAVTQTETGRLAYAGENVSSPRDLANGVYGGFGTQWEQAILDTMIAHDGGTPDYEAVVLHTSVYDALRSGEIDFALEVLTWQGVENALAGNSVETFRYADYGVPDQHTIILGASGAFLSDKPDLAEAFIAATHAGYLYAVENPQEAADMLIAGAPELAEQAELVHASMQVMIEGNYLARPDGTVGRFDEAMMTEVGEFLFDARVLMGPDGVALSEQPDFSSYFTNRYLD